MFTEKIVNQLAKLKIRFVHQIGANEKVV